MMMERRLSILICATVVMILAGIMAPAGSGAEEIALSSGQTVYVPVYAHIYSGVKGRPFYLAATLSLRNTNLETPITLESVKYYDSAGNLVKDYLSGPKQLNALVSERYIIPEGDKTGGSGANFIVVWRADRPVNPPIIEAVMIGTHSGQGISFVSRGQVLKENR